MTSTVCHNGAWTLRFPSCSCVNCDRQLCCPIEDAGKCKTDLRVSVRPTLQPSLAQQSSALADDWKCVAMSIVGRLLSCETLYRRLNEKLSLIRSIQSLYLGLVKLVIVVSHRRMCRNASPVSRNRQKGSLSMEKLKSARCHHHASTTALGRSREVQ